MSVYDKVQNLPIRERDKDALSKFVREVMRILREEIYSIILYGSSVKRNFFPGSSDLNVLLVLRCICPQLIIKVAPTLKRYSAKDKISTTVHDKEEIENSLDVYPIKFLDIKKYHLILYGEDIFKDLAIDPSNLRIDLERQIREIAIGIRRDYIFSSHTSADMRKIVVKSFSSLSHLMAALLYLMNIEPPVTKEEIVKRASYELNLDLYPFTYILKLKKGTNNPPKKEMEEIFAKYVNTIEDLVKIVDRLSVDGTTIEL